MRSRSSPVLLAALAALTFAASGARAALVAHYTFDEIAGPLLRDSAGAADGTSSNVTFAPSGAGAPGSTGFGNAGLFSAATSSQVAFGSGSHPASFDLGTGDFTVAGWFRVPTNTLGAERTLFQAITTNLATGGFAMQIRRGDRSNAGRVFFTVGGTNFGATQAFSDARVDDDAWHHVAAVNDGGAIALYVDGVLQADGGALDATTTATAPANVEAYFGRYVNNYMDGQLDEWRIYDNTLDAAGVVALYQQNVPEPASLAAASVGIALAARRRRR